MPDCHKVAMLDGGICGTVIATIIAANDQPAVPWMRNGDCADTVIASRDNPTCLPTLRGDEQ